MEMGTYPLWLTEDAATDLLFHDVPNGFLAISGHKERAVLMPSLKDYPNRDRKGLQLYHASSLYPRRL